VRGDSLVPNRAALVTGGTPPSVFCHFEGYRSKWPLALCTRFEALARGLLGGGEGWCFQRAPPAILCPIPLSSVSSDIVGGFPGISHIFPWRAGACPANSHCHFFFCHASRNSKRQGIIGRLRIAIFRLPDTRRWCNSSPSQNAVAPL
jgi:hypothetical protein